MGYPHQHIISSTMRLRTSHLGRKVCNKFLRSHLSYALAGYSDETKRLYGVLDTALDGRDWLIGAGRGIYTIADFNALPWYILFYKSMCHAT
jgi:glutathione S-transferase